MRTLTNVVIPEPCHQQWDNMNPVQGGRYCDHCCKAVIDFTAMSNQQIIDVLSNSLDLCGKFHEWQLHSVNRQLNYQKPKADWKGWMIAAWLFCMIPVSKAQAQHVLKIKEQPLRDKKGNDKQQVDTLKAYYAGYHPQDPDTPKINLRTFVKPETIWSLSGTVGGIQVSETVDKPKISKYYQNIYDLLRDLW